MPTKILIVEDDLLTLENISFLLETQGYKAISAASPSEALEAVRQELPDLIIMDIDLKADMDGIELAARINQDHKIPVVYLTDKNDERIVQKARNIHHAHYIPKPLRLHKNILLSQIELVLKQASDKEPAVPGIEAVFVKARANSTQKTKVLYKDIVYIKAGRNYCTLYVKKNDSKQFDKFFLSRSLREALDILSSQCFIRVHKSYAINIDLVEGIDNKDVIMYGNTSIVLGGKHKAQLLERLNQI